MRETRDEKRGLELREKQFRLPFDQHQRYRIVADTLDRLREDPEPLRILDVGGAEGIVLNFLPEDRITILDQEDVEGLPGFVKGDATALPFEDGSYDYAVSVDVYEHIPSEARERYLSELRRVSRRGVLLAAPFDSDAVRSAERAANEFHRSVHETGNVWLNEHVENGLPELDATKKFFERHGDRLSVLPNGYIPHWLAMICLTFYGPKLKGESNEAFDNINAFYNEFVYELDNIEPCYRYLLVSLKEDVDTDFGASVSVGEARERTDEDFALFGMISAVLPLANEVKQLSVRLSGYERRLNQKERELARKDAQMARKDAQINDLARRLAERIGAENIYQGQMEQRMARLQQDRNQLQQQLTGITGSRAWRVLTTLHKSLLKVRRAFGSG